VVVGIAVCITCGFVVSGVQSILGRRSRYLVGC
jgi:hypothetical protein